MDISYDEVRRIAKLSKIKIEESDVAKIGQELMGIMNWIDQLNEAEAKFTDGEVQQSYKDVHLERSDENPTSDRHEKVLQNAPSKAHNFFVVPKVVG